MTTGDKVLALLGAKAVCCGLLILAGTGALGGAFAWFLDRTVGWAVGAALLVGIAATIWRRSPAKTSPREALNPEEPQAGRRTTRFPSAAGHPEPEW